MILMVLAEKGERCDLLIILRELCEIVLLQQHNLMKYEINLYNVHFDMHEQQLKFDIIKRIIKYDLNVLKINKIVRLLHIITLEFWFDIRKEKEKKENNDSNDSNSQQ